MAGLRSAMVARAKQLGGPGLTVKARCLLRGYRLPRWGNLRRTTPFSSRLGFERGQPIDRFYLHRFRSAHREVIAGDVLEIAGHGNCLSAVGAQLGLALEELTEAELDVHDARFPVLTTMLCPLPR